MLFGGAALQQIGIMTTTAGNAGFITRLVRGHHPDHGTAFPGSGPGWGTWLGASLAVVGLYLLSIQQDMSISQGDLYVLVGAFFWSAHMILIGWLAPRMNPLALAQAQFMVCGLLSLSVALCTETITWHAVLGAGDAIPLLRPDGPQAWPTRSRSWLSRRRDPAHASIILSLEAVFAAAAGWIVLSELLGMREMAGCGLMLAGMLLSQLRP